MDIVVRPDPSDTTRGTLLYGTLVFRCALGKGGVRANKREGDGATPLARMALRRVLYRPDRLARPLTRLPIQALTPRDGWCDDPDSPAYNHQVELPCAARHEALWRDDAVYDLIVALGWNDAPVVNGLGSAIFLHVARSEFGPTEGCVALALGDLLELLAAIPRLTFLRIDP